MQGLAISGHGPMVKRLRLGRFSCATRVRDPPCPSKVVGCCAAAAEEKRREAKRSRSTQLPAGQPDWGRFLRALRVRGPSPVHLPLPPSVTCIRATCPAAQCCWAPFACAGLSAQHVASRSRRARGRVAGAGAAAWVARRQAGGTRVRVAPAAARARPGDAMSAACVEKKKVASAAA